MPDRARRPLVLAVNEHAHSALLQEILGAGWMVQNAGGTGGRRVVTMMSVADRADAQSALHCALRGDGLLVRRASTGPGARGPHEIVVGDLVDDLSRLGRVEVVGAEAILLEPDTWRLVHALSAGMTVTSAARAQHLSVRTANRRISAAKDAFGVATRAQLLRLLSAPGRIRPAVD